MRIVLEGPKGEESIAELCRREASSGEVVTLRSENQQLKLLVADHSLHNLRLRKSLSGHDEPQEQE